MADAWQRPLQNSLALLHSGSQWYEMMLASTTTIGLRLAGIQQNIQDNRPPDTAELQRMVTEKSIAWWQAGTAVMQWQDALVRLYGQASVRELFRLWPTAPGNTVILLMPYATWSNRWMAVMLRGFANTLRPYHARSTANARRLSRKAVRH